ncbi:MAG: preprotein translocase subunit SecY, partial [Ilumatobacteraceae bacterium]
GGLFIAAIAIIPSIIFSKVFHTTSLTQSRGGGGSFAFFGTSVLIMVGVALETMKQIDSQLTMRNYEGFLK